MFEKTLQGAIQVVRCNAPINVDSVEKFDETFADLLRHGQPMIVFDMSGVPLIDGAGLEALLSMQEQFCRRGGDLKISGLNPLCSDILRITQVEKHFSIFEKLIDALGSFSK